MIGPADTAPIMVHAAPVMNAVCREVVIAPESSSREDEVKRRETTDTVPTLRANPTIRKRK